MKTKVTIQETDDKILLAKVSKNSKNIQYILKNKNTKEERVSDCCLELLKIINNKNNEKTDQ